MYLARGGPNRSGDSTQEEYMRIATIIVAGVAVLALGREPATAQAPSRGITTATLAEACANEGRGTRVLTAARVCTEGRE
jgi:hypothetical protein